MIFLFENFAESRLHSGFAIGDDQLEVPSVDAAKFPVPSHAEHRFALVLYDGIQHPEIVWATDNNGTGIFVVERGAEGTVPKNWRAGTVVINTPTKISLNYLSSGGSDSWHELLSERIDEAFAAIQTEASIRQENDGLLAERVDSVQVTADDAKAAAQITATAFVGLQEAWSAYQVEVEAKVDEADARSRTAANAAVEAGQATAELETFVHAAVGTNAAEFAERIQSFADFDEAQVTINTDISTRVGNVETGLTEEVTLRSSQYLAQVGINSSMTARIGEAEGAITTEQSVRASADAALAGRSTLLESEVAAARGSDATLAGRINTIESTSASATGALATRTDTLEAQLMGTVSSGVLARLITEETARASADAALASRTTSLEATREGSRHRNLLRGGDFSQGFVGIWATSSPVWVLHNDAGYGSMAMALGGAVGDHYLYQDLPIYENAVYNLSWTGDGLGLPNRAKVIVEFFNAADVQVGQTPVYDYSDLYWNKRKDFSFSTPAGTTRARVVIVKSNLAGEPSFNLFTSQFMLVVGSLPAEFSDDTSVRMLKSAITVEESARITGDTALANRTTTLEGQVVASANHVPNSTGTQGLKNWTSVGGTPVSFDQNSADGPIFSAAPPAGTLTPVLRADLISWPEWAMFSFQVDVYMTGTTAATVGSVRAYVQFVDAATNHLGYYVLEAWGNTGQFVKLKGEGLWPPAGTAKIWLHLDTYNVTWGVGAFVAWKKVKFERGPRCTIWTDEKADSLLAARVQTSEGIIANAGNLDAWWQVQAIAGSAMAGIRAKANSAGGSEIGMIADGIALFNTVLGVAQEVLKASGGEVFIKKKLTLGNFAEIILDPAYPALIITIGASTMVLGKIPNDNLIFWFGPTQTVGNMRKSNARIWMDTAGNAYWGGQIFSGTLSNSVQGSNLNVPATVSLGPFGTNGNPITVNWSYNYYRRATRFGNQTPSGTVSATIRLYRTIAGSAETLLDTKVITGSFTYNYDGEPIPGQPPGTVGHTAMQEYMGAAFTFTDNAGGTNQRTFRIEVVSRTIAGFPGESWTMDDRSQSYAITTSE